MVQNRSIAFVAHDTKKTDLVEWADFNKDTLARHKLYVTGNTGKQIIEKTGLKINLLKWTLCWRHGTWCFYCQ